MASSLSASCSSSSSSCVLPVHSAASSESGEVGAAAHGPVASPSVGSPLGPMPVSGTPGGPLGTLVVRVEGVRLLQGFPQGGRVFVRLLLGPMTKHSRPAVPPQCAPPIELVVSEQFTFRIDGDVIFARQLFVQLCCGSPTDLYRSSSTGDAAAGG
eukprot:RCo055057